jgi:hypothetical protein
VAHQHGALHLRVVHDGFNRPRKIIHAVSSLRFIALAVTGKIDCNHAAPLREVSRLVAPAVYVLRPTVNQHQRFIALAVVHVMNLRTIELRPTRLSRALVVFSRALRRGGVNFTLVQSRDRQRKNENNGQEK